MTVIIKFLKATKAESRAKTRLAKAARLRGEKEEEAPQGSSSRRNDAWNWSATSGQTIQGNLARGAGGVFETANVNAREAVSGLSDGDYDAANAFARGGRIDDATLQRLGEAGLLTRNAKGQAVTTGASRLALLGRRASVAEITRERNERKQKDAMSIAEQKKQESERKGAEARDAAEKKAEAKAAKTAKDREDAKVRAAQEKDAAQAKALADQSKAAKAKEEEGRRVFADTSLAAGLPADQLAALMDFIKGTDVQFKGAMGNALERLGLLAAVQGEASYTIGSTANGFLNAAMAGNVRGAKDILTMARFNRRQAEAQAAQMAAQGEQSPTVQQDAQTMMVIPQKTFTPTLIKRRKELTWAAPVLFRKKEKSQTIILFPRETSL